MLDWRRSAEAPLRLTAKSRRTGLKCKSQTRQAAKFVANHLLGVFKSMKLSEQELRWLTRWEKRERQWLPIT
jgi:hypothetical protein